MKAHNNSPKTVEETNNKIESMKRGINIEDLLRKTMKLPVARVDRKSFLRKELRNKYPTEMVELAMDYNPAYAGIQREEIDAIAKSVITYETNKVSVLSFAAGIPGGIALSATVPVDVTQYFVFILRVMQKLAYLYGFEEFDLHEDDIDDETMNEILVFLGTMFGVQEANAAIKIVAGITAKNIAKKLSKRALTKGIIYPIIKKIAKQIGAEMTKQIFANGVSKIVPIIGGVLTGGLTYLTFKPCAKNLKKSLCELPISDPSFYKNDNTIIYQSQHLDIN